MNDRFKFRIWEVDNSRYRINKNCNPVTDFLLNTQTGEIQVGEGFEVYGEDISELILEQCTGLKDKDGKLIYEGDIISDEKYDNQFGRCFIGYCTEEKQFQPMQKFDNEIYCHSCNGDYNWIDILEKRFEVIGNIHENPELLEIVDEGF